MNLSRLSHDFLMTSHDFLNWPWFVPFWPLVHISRSNFLACAIVLQCTKFLFLSNIVKVLSIQSRAGAEAGLGSVLFLMLPNLGQWWQNQHYLTIYKGLEGTEGFGFHPRLFMLFMLILGHFWCSVVTSVNYSSNLSNFKKKVQKSQ